MGSEKLAKNKDILGYFDIEEGRLSIKREPTGQDLLTASSSPHGTIAYMISAICLLDDRPISPQDANDLGSEVNVAIETDIIQGDYQLLHNQEEDYYYFADKPEDRITFLPRKIRHDSHAQKLAMGNTSAIAFFLLSQLMQVNGKSLRHDKVLDMPAGKVQAMLPKIMPKKLSFVRIKR